jgi:hypothetical protein
MTLSPEPTVIKLDELSDLVNAVPHLLGFTPTESLVAVSLRGPRERMEFTIRIDLVPAEHDAEVADMFAARMRAAEADSVVIFVYTADEPSECGLPRRELVDRLVEAMPMEVREALLVSDERVWSYLCDDEICCPPEGRPRLQTPGSLALSAAHALYGHVVLPDRDAVVASVQPVSGEHAVAMGRALDEAKAAWAALDPRRARTKARRLATKIRARYESPPATLTDDEAASLIVAMHDWRIRDTLLGWASGESDTARTLLHDLAIRAVPPFDAPACAAFAWVSYTHGSCLVAAIALDRALASDPAYSLATLLQEALARQVRPSVLRWPSAE